jgi:hypothetical protein
MQDGYFYDEAAGGPWVPHGIAYQLWNRPLGVWQTYEQIDYDLDEMVNQFVQDKKVQKILSVSDAPATDNTGATIGLIRVVAYEQ